MMRLATLTLLMIVAVSSGGCCLFRCYDGNPDPVETLKPKRVPLQIANNLAFRLSTVFFDESKRYKAYLQPVSGTSPELQRVVFLLSQKLFREPHVAPTPKDTADYHVFVKVDPASNGETVILTVVRGGKTILTHSEPLVEKGSN